MIDTGIAGCVCELIDITTQRNNIPLSIDFVQAFLDGQIMPLAVLLSGFKVVHTVLGSMAVKG
jgi:hypothetical protein